MSCTFSSTENLTVLVYFHGGGYVNGGYGDFGPEFYLDHDVVLVQAHYRLGPLGFLCLGGGTSVPGNAGLRDQVLALEWVRDHVADFGGDPADVTALGSSAGAYSVAHLMVSGAAAGLFGRAVAGAGAAGSPAAFEPRPVEYARKFAR